MLAMAVRCHGHVGNLPGNFKGAFAPLGCPRVQSPTPALYIEKDVLIPKTVHFGML